jgi:hypothetical protein
VTSPFDRQLAARAAAVSALAWLVAAAVVAATDEGRGWAPRAGLVAALAPIAGAVGAWTALGVAALRGEVRALGAVGVPPGRIAVSAALGGVAPSLVGAFAAATPWIDLAALFPRAPSLEAWRRDGADLVATGLGLRVAPGGTMTFEGEAAALVAAGAPSRHLVALALVVAAIALPLAACAPRPNGRRLLALGAALALAIVLFQAVAAGRLAAAWLVVAPLALLVDAAPAYRLERA